MDCIDLIEADHNRGRGLFKRFKSAKESENTEDMKLLATTIVEELTVHMAVEEEIFYPAISGKTEDIEDTVYEGFEEHHVGKVLVDELSQMEAGSKEWATKVGVLIEVTEHHMEEEESDMLPKVRNATSAEVREKLGLRMYERAVELGAPPLEPAMALKKSELDEMAKEQEIPGRSKLDKEHLAATVDRRTVA
ncbi:MAG TPA: hemerythrin domain-containing protein [Acidimicrobiales bacterium]|nr:hemerythrin domain-containing protein [Acidimicrobiales bacterium]